MIFVKKFLIVLLLGVATTTCTFADQQEKEKDSLDIASEILTPFIDEFMNEWVSHGNKNSENNHDGGFLSSILGNGSSNPFSKFNVSGFFDKLKNIFLDVVLEERFNIDKELREYPYWRFIPMHVTNILPEEKDSTTINKENTWESKCFFKNTAEFTRVKGDSTYELTIRSENAKVDDNCEDFYAFLTVTGLSLKVIKPDSNDRAVLVTNTIDWSLPRKATVGQIYDIENVGMRVFKFNIDVKQSIYSLYKTLLLFKPITTQSVDEASAAMNVDFLNKYTSFHFEKRDPKDNIIPDESEIKSGDFFGILRLDGLDPMLAWAMGSVTGHTTMALWIEEELYVVESQTTSSYWDVNFVQKTPYREWVKKGQEASYNVAHIPLAQEYRERFNEENAIKWFSTVEGLQYGYYTMLWSWIDTPKANYPCAAPDFKTCLTWEFVEPMFGLVDHYFPHIANLMWVQAFNHRIIEPNKHENLVRTAELYMEADKKGIIRNEIPTIVESDEWRYKMLRYNKTNFEIGQSMVCCTFVCNGWKNGGIFEDSINNELNCGELTNFDDYNLNIFEGSYQQFNGAYTVVYNEFNKQKPYSNMYQTCPSQNPLYTRPDTC